MPVFNKFAPVAFGIKFFGGLKVVIKKIPPIKANIGELATTTRNAIGNPIYMCIMSVELLMWAHCEYEILLLLQEYFLLNPP